MTLVKRHAQVRDGKTFLDLIAEQVEHTRKSIGAKVGLRFRV